MAQSRKEKNRTISALDSLRSSRPGMLFARHAALHAGLDDREVAIIVATTLEQAFEEALGGFFVGDNVPALKARLMIGSGDSDPPLGSYYAKSWLAHALGVFGSQTMEDLNTIRKIRNVFAHSAMPLKFDYQAISEACVFSLPSRLPPQSDINKRMPLSARDLYCEVGILIASMISSIVNVKVGDQFSEETVKNMHDSFRALLT